MKITVKQWEELQDLLITLWDNGKVWGESPPQYPSPTAQMLLEDGKLQVNSCIVDIMDLLGLKMEDRFFIDERTGIIAVRDRKYTDPDYRGLHSDTPGVVKSWMGFNDGIGWELYPKDVEECKQFLNDLISGKIDYEPDEDWTEYKQ